MFKCYRTYSSINRYKVKTYKVKPVSLFMALLTSVLLTGCGNVQLAHAQNIWGLWLIPLLILFYVYAFRSKTRALGRFADPKLLAMLTRGSSRPRQYLKAGLIVCAVTFAILALLGFEYGFTWEEVHRKGVDIVIALDVSDSMLVEDATQGEKLTRLTRAKREIADLLRMLDGDRISLVAFSGAAFMQCPMTLDYGAAEMFLGSMDNEIIPTKGTHLGEAIRVSLKSLDGGNQQSQAIILITDGEDHEGGALKVAEEAKTQGVRIFTIGIGRDEGSPIPAPNGGFRRDRQGDLILSKLDEPTLQKIALTTGGRYVRSVVGDMDLEQIYRQGIKATLVDRDLDSQRRQHWHDRFQWLLALSFVLLLLESFISERAITITLFFFAPLLFSATAHAQPATNNQPPVPTNQPQPPIINPAQPAINEIPPDAAAPTTIKLYNSPYEAFLQGAYDQALAKFVDLQIDRPNDAELLLNIAATQYKMQDYEAAQKSYFSASLKGDESVRNRAAYALGNVTYRQGKLDKAIEHYQRALELDPNDADAKFNIEYTRNEIRRRHEENKKRQEEQKKQEGDQKEGNDKNDDQEQQNDKNDGEKGEGSEGSKEEDDKSGDQDQDGLADELEDKNGNGKVDEGETDPTKADTDNDGRPDGEEDENRNGKVDEGESDPTKADKAPEQKSDSSQGEAGADQESEPNGESRELSPEEAQRYLDSLDEKSPQKKRRKGRRGRNAKDW